MNTATVWRRRAPLEIDAFAKAHAFDRYPSGTGCFSMAVCRHAPKAPDGWVDVEEGDHRWRCATCVKRVQVRAAREAAAARRSTHRPRAGAAPGAAREGEGASRPAPGCGASASLTPAGPAAPGLATFGGGP